MVHWQTDDFFCHLGGNREVLFCRTGQAPVGGEVADEGIEVASAKDSLLLHLEVELVSRHAVFLGIDEDGEVTVVVLHAGHVVPELDAFDIS